MTTEETVLTVLAGLADNVATGLLFPIGLDAWDPQMVRWTCMEDAAEMDSLMANTVSPAPPAP